MKPFNLSRGTLIVIGGLVVASAVGYIFNPLLIAPILGPKGVAVLGAFLYLFAMLTFPQTPLAIMMIRYTSDYNAAGNPGKVTALIRGMMKKVSAAGLIFALVLAFFSPAIARYLKLASPAPVLAAIALAYVQLIATVFQAPLQGLLRFNHFIGSMIADPVCRLLIGGLLLAIGLGAGGAMIGYLAGAGACLFAAWWFLRKDIRTEVPQGPVDFSECYAYALSACLYAAYLAFAQSIDGLMVKHYFPDQAAGIYIASASLAKLILIPIGPLSNVAFSFMSDSVSRKKDPASILKKTAALAAAFYLAELLLFCCAPRLIIRLTYGRDFLDAAAILPFSAVAMFPLCFIMIFAQLGLANKDNRFVIGLLAGGAIHFLLLVLVHHSLPALILAHTAGGAAELALCLFFSKNKPRSTQTCCAHA